MKWITISVLFALPIFVISSGSAVATNMSPQCRADFKTWKRDRGPNAAFAVAANGACGFSWGYRTAKLAIGRAVTECGKRGSNCKIIATKKGTPPKRALSTTTTSEEQARIACRKKYWGWNAVVPFKKNGQWWCRGKN